MLYVARLQAFDDAHACSASILQTDPPTSTVRPSPKWPGLDPPLIFCSFSIEQPNSYGILVAVKRNPIVTVETPEGARPARLNPVEVDVIHLFV